MATTAKSLATKTTFSRTTTKSQAAKITSMVTAIQSLVATINFWAMKIK